MSGEQELVAQVSAGYGEHLRHVEKRKALLKNELESCLPANGSIVLEIGCGHGHWLTEYATVHHDSLCLGIDLMGKRIDRANRKANRAGLNNVRFLKGEATELLEQLPADVFVQSVFILFPDPWPKKRHWKNRIINSAFLNLLANRCLGGARLHFRTDHSEYFDWASNKVESLDRWKRVEEGAWPFEHETVFQSKAESYQSMILERQ